MAAASSSSTAPTAGFSVVIVACGPVAATGDLVYAVAVAQPVQSWTVLRCQADFTQVYQAIMTTNNVNGVNHKYAPPPRPVGTYDLADLVRVRNELQTWLATVLMNASVRETSAMRQFLTMGANTIPPQYETVPWTQFTNVSPAVPSPTAAALAANGTGNRNHHAATAGNEPSAVGVDDMDMDYMFMGEDDGATPHEDDNGEDYDDEDYIPSAAVRYQPTDEEVAVDEMDILAGEVEMIEDVGSLAQSMGASHLGRSLQLQAEMQRAKVVSTPPCTEMQHTEGIKMGVAPQKSPSTTTNGSGGGNGGIGSAMASVLSSGQAPPPYQLQQQPPPVAAFNYKPPQSAPRLDSFKMLKVIGKGSFGKVFLVKENKTGEIYALKVLRKDNIIKRNQIEHTKTERSVLGYVRHPFIVGMNMAFQSKDKLYFVLDYCAGGELFFHLGRLGRFQEPRAQFYAAEIVLAISYVHSLDIVYRDLKPENVLLDDKGHIRLTDFGLSKEGISSSSSGAHSFCGTPEYLAPEILNRQGHGRAVDWWSLGALLYEMLTGLPPFYCQDRERLFEKIRRSELSYPPIVSSDAKSLLKGLLTKDPTHRLGSGPDDAEEIKKHGFFSPISWEKLYKGEIPPPWVPDIKGSLDTSQFDKEFTNMPVFSPQSVQRGNGVFSTTPAGPGDNPFEGFTFTDHRSFVEHAARTGTS